MAQICRIDVRAVGGYVLFGHIPCNLQESCPPQKAGCLSNTPVFAKCLVDWLHQCFWPIQSIILWVIPSATAAAFAAHHHSSICRSCGQRGFSIAAICWISTHWIVAVPVDSIVVHLKHLSIERLPIGLTMGRLWPDWMQYQSNPAYTHLTRFMAMMFRVQVVVWIEVVSNILNMFDQNIILTSRQHDLEVKASKTNEDNEAFLFVMTHWHSVYCCCSITSFCCLSQFSHPISP